MQLKIEQVSFDIVLPIWYNKLWINRKSDIKSMSSIQYLGGIDMDIYQYKPSFWAIYDGSEVIGVNSGFKTKNDYYRSRGIWINPDYRGKNLSNLLFVELEKQAILENCNNLWSMPRKGSHYAYLKFGFKQTSEFFDEGVEFGPNCYVLKNINL